MNKYTFSTQTGKAYYCNSIPGFVKDESTNIVGRLVRHAFDINKEQANAWENQISELQRRLEECGMEGDIIFEYDIVRLGKRIDVILLHFDPFLSKNVPTKFHQIIPLTIRHANERKRRFKRFAIQLSSLHVLHGVSVFG